MNTKRATILHGATVLSACALIAAPGCGGFLGLEDYQRDLFGAVAAAVLFLPADGATGQPVPGGDGVSCWDLNGNGQGDPEEDANGDGAFDALDCAGEPGSPGRGGTDGTSGVSCWDLNGNGIAEADEDVNGDGDFDARDCQGSPGAPGTSGSSGSSGVDGETFFHVLVDDFFAASGTPEGSLPIRVVSIDEPVLGVFPAVSGIGNGVNSVAYRVAVPEIYDAGHDVTMRIALFRTGPLTGGCFAVQLVAKRLRNGFGVEDYGTPRWIRIDLSDEAKAAARGGAGAVIVLDLPMNTAAGLDLPDDLKPAEFLAFELTTHQDDGGAYQLLTVEFDEARAGTGTLGGATIFLDDPEGEVPCGFVDCNENGFADSEDIAEERSNDCDRNGVPDECASCPPLDLVFVMDTSGSMDNEAAALCNGIQQVVANLTALGIDVVPSFLGITEDAELDSGFPCLTDSVLDMLGGAVPGTTDVVDDTEDWGPATAVVADRFPWTEGSIRVIVPISDEDPQDGDGCNEGDSLAITNAIAFAQANSVFVSPIVAELEAGRCDPVGDPNDCLCIEPLATQLADETGGMMTRSTDPDADLAGTINALVVDICRGVSDCNGNGTPDECEIRNGRADDCNENRVPDTCEIAVGTDASGGPFFCTANCDPDINENGIPDACDPVPTLEGIWRFDLPVGGNCGLGQPAGVQTEVRYLRFDASNNLMENWIVLDTECLNFGYPSTGGPNLHEFRDGGIVSQDTDRLIVSQMFDPQTGSMHFEESVDVPNNICVGEEGTTTLDGIVSGDGISGTWEFRMAIDVVGQCVEFPSIFCGDFTAVRVAGPPDCTILTPPAP